mgnify:CR=1 FL=1
MRNEGEFVSTSSSDLVTPQSLTVNRVCLTSRFSFLEESKFTCLAHKVVVCMKRETPSDIFTRFCNACFRLFFEFVDLCELELS